jgi:pantothenate kinase
MNITHLNWFCSTGDSKRYEKYLESVVETNENDYFEGINDILIRYETLQRIMKSLKNQVDANEKEVEKFKHSLANFIKVSNN